VSEQKNSFFYPINRVSDLMCKDLLRLEPVTSENIAEPVPLDYAAVIQMSLSFMRVCKFSYPY
jgi:hypothetical protein